MAMKMFLVAAGLLLATTATFAGAAWFAMTRFGDAAVALCCVAG